MTVYLIKSCEDDGRGSGSKQYMWFSKVPPSKKDPEEVIGKYEILYREGLPFMKALENVEIYSL